MDNTIPAFRPDVVALHTAPRPTATPARVPFAQMLAGGARALVQGAQAAVRALPGAPVVAAAVRGGSLGAAVSSGASSGAPEGPAPQLAAGGLAAGMLTPGVGAAGALGAPGAADGSIEGSLAQSQQMNLYYLQIQQQVNDDNRAFTLLSNVLEVEHNTAKSAIGNIH
jgi:hypothetical protein